MKFGKYIQEQRATLPEELQRNCLDYKALKQMIKPLRSNLSKNAFFPPNFKPSGADVAQILVPNFSELVDKKLTDLKELVIKFLDMLDAEVRKLNRCYVAEAERLQQTHQENLMARSAQTVSDAVARRQTTELLDQVVKLETFVFLNYTGIVKILKKKEKVTGLDIREPYLYRISMLSFSKSVSVAGLKSTLLAELSSTPTPPSIEPPTKRARTDMLDDSSRDHVRATIEAATRTSSRDDSVTLTSIFKPIVIGQQPKNFAGLALQSSQKIIATITGSHDSDIFHASMAVFARHHSKIHNLSLSRLHSSVTVGALTSLPSEHVEFFRDLMEEGSKHDAVVNFEVQAADGNIPLDLSANCVITLVDANGLSSEALADVAQLMLKTQVAVSRLIRLSHADLTAVELQVAVLPNTHLPGLQSSLTALATEHHIDAHFQFESIFRRTKRLAVFDMDSTLIQQEVIDELARHAGVYDDVKRITEESMQGKLDFKQSLKKRVDRLSGLSSTALDVVKQQLQLTEGALPLCRALKKLGVKTAVISGGFMPMALHIKEILGLDYAFANELEMSSDGTSLTGNLLGDIVDAQRKADLLNLLATTEKIQKNQVIAVGDGANDLLMLAEAGVGIAFNAKPLVQEKASFRINNKSLLTILYMFGLSDKDIEVLVA